MEKWHSSPELAPALAWRRQRPSRRPVPPWSLPIATRIGSARRPRACAQRVTTPSAAGQYSVNLTTGIYTFAAADANASLLVSYLYNISSSGKKLVLTNQFMGFTPTFKATFYTTKTTGSVPAGLALVLNACTAMKLSLPTKTDDYEIQEFDFSAFADAAGRIGTLSVNE